jgi:hypothetical protein
MSRRSRREPLSDYSSDSDYEPPPKKENKKQPKEKVPTENERSSGTQSNAPEPVVSKPKRVKLSQSRRLEIIANKRNGIDDPEYSAIQNPATGSWRVCKRKEFLSPTSKIEASSPPNQDIHLTWMNMQASVNESIGNELERLSKKYDKISAKYQEKKEKKQPKEEPEEQRPKAESHMPRAKSEAAVPREEYISPPRRPEPVEYNRTRPVAQRPQYAPQPYRPPPTTVHRYAVRRFNVRDY